MASFVTFVKPTLCLKFTSHKVGLLTVYMNNDFCVDPAKWFINETILLLCRNSKDLSLKPQSN